MKNILPTFPKPDTHEHVDEIISSVSKYMGFSSELPNITSADDLHSTTPRQTYLFILD